MCSNDFTQSGRDFEVARFEEEKKKREEEEEAGMNEAGCRVGGGRSKKSGEATLGSSPGPRFNRHHKRFFLDILAQNV